MYYGILVRKLRKRSLLQEALQYKKSCIFLIAFSMYCYRSDIRLLSTAKCLLLYISLTEYVYTFLHFKLLIDIYLHFYYTFLKIQDTTPIWWNVIWSSPQNNCLQWWSVYIMLLKGIAHISCFHLLSDIKPFGLLILFCLILLISITISQLNRETFCIQVSTENKVKYQSVTAASLVMP